MHDTDDEIQLPAKNLETPNLYTEEVSLTPKTTLLPEIETDINLQPNNIVSEIPQSSNSEFPIKKRWEGRIAHPRRLVSSMKANLEDLGYKVKANYEDQAGPVRDTSYFEGNISAKQDYESRNKVLFILGILSLIIVIGYWILKKSNRIEQSLIKIEFEGESYYVEARQEHSMNIPNEARLNYSERTGVLSDISIILQAGVFSGINLDINMKPSRSNDSDLFVFTKKVTENISNIWNNSTII